MVWSNMAFHVSRTSSHSMMIMQKLLLKYNMVKFNLYKVVIKDLRINVYHFLLAIIVIPTYI